MGENSDRSDSHGRSRGLVAIDSPCQGYEVENPKYHERALQPRHSVGVHGQEPSTLRVALETNGAPPTTPAGQRIEQMRQLADIFASIFEALPDKHEHAIATTRQAA